MLKIKILYESKFSLSTTRDGENLLTGLAKLSENPQRGVKEIFSKENTFLENMKLVSSFYPNYKYQPITKNTVMGILCRLCGEVRRLDSLPEDHPIMSLIDKIDFVDVNTDFQNETMQIHTPIKEVQNNAGGLISSEKSKHFLLSNSDLSETLFNIFKLETQEEIINCLKSLDNGNEDESFIYAKFPEEIKANTFVIEHALAEAKQKESVNGLFFKFSDGHILKEILGKLLYGKEKDIDSLIEYVNSFTNPEDLKMIDFSKRRKEMDITEVYNIQGFLFAKKLLFIKNKGLFEDELNGLINSVGSIRGLAPLSGSLTIKDYYANFIDEKKLSWTMPYFVTLQKDLFKKEDVKEFNTFAKIGITKESGVLTISLDLTEKEEFDLLERIEQASVSTFQMGKKGLAYIESIEMGMK